MQDQKQVFADLVRSYLELLGEQRNQLVETDDHLVNVDGRIVQIRYAGAGTMLISTAIFLAENDGEILEEPIAEFNVAHLLAGGYSLLVDEKNLSVYVEQGLCLDAFNAGALAAHLADFASRAVSCSRWYRALLGNSQPPPLPDVHVSHHIVL